MKVLIFYFLVLTSHHLHALDEDPATFCTQNNLCTDKMVEISKDYKNGNINFTTENLSGFSGSCFHISSLYDSNHEHHGAFIFERSDKDLMADGIFMFFYDTDPFKEMNSIQLKDWFTTNNSQMVKTIQKRKQIEMQFLGDNSDYHYWFRNNKRNNHLALIGKQSNAFYLGFVFCDMTHR